MSRYAESLTQRLFVRRVRLDPRTRDLPFCAIPNGGTRKPREAARMKGEGVEAGAPDWMLFVPSKTHTGLALEFKSEKGRVSVAQKAFHVKLCAHGWRVECPTTPEGAWSALCDHLNLSPE